MNKNSIVVINQDSGYLMIDLLNAMVASGMECTLITGRLVIRNKKLDQAVHLRKIIRYDRSNFSRRIWTWGTGTIQIFLLLLFKYHRWKLLLVSNPPPSFLLTLLLPNSYSLLVYDIYPDVFSEMGLFSASSPVIKIWENANKRIYNKATNVFTLTEGMRQHLVKYTSPERIHIVPVWTDNHFLKPMDKTLNPFIKQHGLSGKFVVLYSGNLGMTYNAECILELAELTKEKDNIIYIIIGEGEKKAILQNKLISSGLSNCLMLPFLAAEELPYSLSSADIAIIILDKKASTLSVPSKTFNFLSVGAPLLCIAEKESELAKLVDKYKTGRIFSSCQLEQMKDFVIELSENIAKKRAYQENSLRASSDFTEERAALIINRILNS